MDAFLGWNLFGWLAIAAVIVLMVCEVLRRRRERVVTAIHLRTCQHLAFVLAMLSLIAFSGCGVAKATPQAGESAASIAVTYASLVGDQSPNVTPDVPGLRCGGDKIITHGDGHTTPCPGCVDCQAKSSSLGGLDIRPAVYTRTRQVVDAAPAPVAVETSPELPTVVALGDSCADGSCALPGGTVAAGDCASGSCGAASGGPIRNAIKARPFKRFRERIRERPLLRRLFGRR